jgi:hypothetical protein
MRTLSIISSFLVLGALVAPAQPAAPPQRSTGQVSLRANDKTVRPERKRKRDEEEKKDGQIKTETVTKSLDVNISAARTITGPLKLVISWYGRDFITRKQVLANKEESEVALDENKAAKASSTFAFVATPAQTVKGPDGKAEEVKASGHSYAGWIIRAYDGEKLVGETASSPALLKLRD